MSTTKRPARKPKAREIYDHDISFRRILRRNHGPVLSFNEAAKHNPYSHVPDLNPHWRDEEFDRMGDYSNIGFTA